MLGKNLFFYILTVTILSAGLIILNALLGMVIPFSVLFLVGFVAACLVFVIIHSILTKGWRTTFLMLSVSFVIAFTAEALGVNFGWIFGNYYYTPKLGPQLFGVPFLAALAWEPILYASYMITEILVLPFSPNHSSSWLNRLISISSSAMIGAIATTAWDLMIDPIAVSQGWWIWSDGGEYIPYLQNGVPIQNYIGWLLVAFTIHFVFRLINYRGAPSSPSSAYLSIYGPVTLYSSLFITSFGVTLTVLNRPEIALVGIMAMGPFIILSLVNMRFLIESAKFKYA